MAVAVDRVLQAVRDQCPPRFAMEGDATGLQVGRGDRQVERVLTTLDLTWEVAEEARVLGAGLIVSHHAVIFRPLKTLRTDTFKGRILELLIQNEIAVYVPHTALDVVPGGMNDHLAASVGLVDPVFLKQTGADESQLLRVARPDDMEALAALAHERGALVVQERGAVVDVVIAARQATKLAQKLEQKLGLDVRVLPLASDAAPRGIGRIGKLAQPETLRGLATRLKQVLHAPGVRVAAPDLERDVKKVAVLGGDGRRFMNDALFRGADALVTGDVDHHTALEANQRGIALIDVGHWASERHVATLLAEGIGSRLADEPVEVVPSQVDTQPFVFV